ncbi:sulfate permease [Nesterenkonia ebinurensis]|uniref:sulfate permease n=1 Tax=Nesterenkonia ebinurensis TaxID=2608252 RepID=UPI00123CA25E|nr:sulfate permease [Nesterenkonia ebinurensis]
MIRLIWAASVHTRYFLRRYMPTNILLDLIRTRRGLKWGIPAMLLAIPYLFAATMCRGLIEDGGPGSLNLLVLLFIYNAMKFTIMGPVSLVLLARVRLREWEQRQRRDQQRGEVNDGARISVDGALVH